MSDAKSFQILNVNHAARKNLGYSVEELRHLKLWNLIAGLTQESLDELIAPLRAGELDAQEFETVHRRKDGTTYPVAIQLQFMATQSPPVFAAIAQDTTER